MTSISCSSRLIYAEIQYKGSNLLLQALCSTKVYSSHFHWSRHCDVFCQVLQTHSSVSPFPYLSDIPLLYSLSLAVQSGILLHPLSTLLARYPANHHFLLYIFFSDITDYFCSFVFVLSFFSVW